MDEKECCCGPAIPSRGPGEAEKDTGLSRRTLRADADKKKLLNRLKRIEGQVRGLEGLIERNAYCNEILTQTAAVNAALSSFAREILSAHMHTCVARDLREGNDAVIDELMTTLQKLMR